MDLNNLPAGVIPSDWRLRHVLAATEPDMLQRFVDIAAPQTLQYLRRVLASEVAALSLQDFDLSTVTGPQRLLTQRCARLIYDVRDDNGNSAFAGIRYPSRLNPAWECWALFSDRMVHTPDIPASIFPDNPDLLAVCRLFGLSVETFSGERGLSR